MKKTRREFISDICKISVGAVVVGNLLEAKKSFADSFFKGKVVVVYDENALDSSQNINQAVVKKMIETGVTRLTGENDLRTAWNLLLPNIEPVDKIGIKVNCIASHSDLRSHPSVVNSVIEELLALGSNVDNLVVWDRRQDNLAQDFTINVNGSGVKYYAPSWTVVNDSQISSVGNFAQILVDARYLINMPILRCHARRGGSPMYFGLTFALKSFVGAVSNPEGTHPGYQSNSAIFDQGLMADVYTQSHIKNKSKIIIGEALKGSTITHEGGAANFFPKKMIIANDPVACDAVALEILREYKGGTTDSLYYRRARTYIERADQLFGLGESNLANIERINVDMKNIVTNVKKDKYSINKQNKNLAYPNPFNPECYIPIENIRKNENIKVKVYNMLGQVVREINTNNANNSVYWDGRDNFGKEVASGMYFYEVLVGNRVQSCKKMLMLK